MSDPHYEKLRHMAARHVYRLEKTGTTPKKFKTWKEWWTGIYGHGQSFDDYVREKQSEKDMQSLRD